ncbi:unnamed protein product [Allacma fusca]|uniref:Uncharacterized protein n=1 Tax=Allacma fusca TaxID=39272 RepID=A0A8J2JZ96_9HEXA|nr:unnamed protein product [Allacma fusca]
MARRILARWICVGFGFWGAPADSLQAFGPVSYHLRGPKSQVSGNSYTLRNPVRAPSRVQGAHTRLILPAQSGGSQLLGAVRAGDITTQAKRSGQMWRKQHPYSSLLCSPFPHLLGEAGSEIWATRSENITRLGDYPGTRHSLPDREYDSKRGSPEPS